MRDTKSDNLSRELSDFVVLKQTCLTINEYIIIKKTIIKEEGSQEKTTWSSRNRASGQVQ
ncbi:MAG: hypothetical protein D3914_11155 [Candidatus Electrothrix sp. LOE2]|nr:hypothetical protein [Candidatus Electrothrix sp. LOE2]